MRTLTSYVVTLATLSGAAGAMVTGCEEAAVVDLDEVCRAEAYLTKNMREAPQICPRINPINLCEQFIPEGGNAEQITWELMLDNLGQGLLEIESVEVRHDRRCAFEDPLGTIEIWDNDDSDDHAATVRSSGAAFLRIQYRPPSPGEDAVTVTVNSNAENFPSLDVFICGAGTTETLVSCQIRTSADCSPSHAPCDVRNPCAMFCSGSSVACETSDDCGDGEHCASPEYCVAFDPEDQENFDPTNPTSGTCECRPCAEPAPESWGDCGD